MSQFCLKFVYKNLDTLRPLCIHPLIVVLDVLETQNFTGLLLISIQTNPTWFGTNPGNFWKMFIFVHFVHSEAQELSAGSYLALLSSFQPCPSYWIISRANECIYRLKKTLSQFCPNFVSCIQMYTICIQKSGFINSYVLARHVSLLAYVYLGTLLRHDWRSYMTICNYMVIQ